MHNYLELKYIVRDLKFASLHPYQIWNKDAHWKVTSVS